MFKNILCPVDLMPKSKMALRKALSIAHQFDSHVILLHVNESFLSKDEMVMSRVSVTDLQDEFKAIALQAKEDMKTLVKDLELESVDCEYILRDGKTADAIHGICNEKDIDLIVMGTNGRDSVSDVILGSTAEQVIKNIKCPTLIVPIGG